MFRTLRALVVCFVPVGFTAPSAALQSQVSPPDALLAGAQCQAALRAQLEQWGAQFQGAMPDPPGPTGLRSTRIPTGIVGIWIRIAEEAPGALAVERVTATRIERLRFDDTCTARELAVASAPLAADAYGDSDVIARVAPGRRGVFLLWSPHMPLSVDQYAVLADVARTLDLIVVPLLDPGADRKYAERIVRERGLPEEALRPLGGVELLFRGMATHTPSLQLFAGGSLVGPVLYGYRSREALRARLEEALAGR